MSKKNKSTSSQKMPETPQPAGERYYEDDFLRSSRVFDKGRNQYITNTYSTDDERRLEHQATSRIRGIVEKAQGAFDGSPEQMNAYREAYAAPQRRALRQGYNDALGETLGAANASGMRNSVGFENYRAGKIDRQLAEGLADIEGNAHLMGYELPSKAIAPYMDMYNLYNAALSGEQARQMATIDPAMQGSNSLNSFNLANYGNQMAGYQQGQPQQKKGGFFTKLFGG